MLLRFEGPDGGELDTVTIRCDDEGAAWLTEALRDEDSLQPPELDAAGYEVVKGERVIQIASSTPNDPSNQARPS